MTIVQGYRYELDPNDRQETLLRKTAGAARFAWNWALATRLEILSLDPTKVGSAPEDHRRWNAWKRENAKWAFEVSKCAPQEAIRDLYRAFARWRRERNRATPMGPPRFKEKGRRDSFRLTGQIHLRGRGIQLPTLGRIRLKERPMFEGRILSATVVREADRWFVAVTVERPRAIPSPRTGPALGIDLGLRPFAVFSDGTRIEGLRPLEKSLDKLRRLTRRWKRKEKHSRNRAKAQTKLSKLYVKVRNQRADFLNKLTTTLAKTKPVIVIEDLNTRRLIRNRILGRSIMDAAWGEFARKLAYKSIWYGASLIIANRNFPSTRCCSACGVIADRLPRDLKKWTCEACGTTHDRDLNAARNLAAYGTASRAETAGESRKTTAEIPLTAERRVPVYESWVDEAGSGRRAKRG